MDFATGGGQVTSIIGNYDTMSLSQKINSETTTHVLRELTLRALPNNVQTTDSLRSPVHPADLARAHRLQPQWLFWQIAECALTSFRYRRKRSSVLRRTLRPDLRSVTSLGSPTANRPKVLGETPLCLR
jgi:hypothetical protein